MSNRPLCLVPARGQALPTEAGRTMLGRLVIARPDARPTSIEAIGEGSAALRGLAIAMEEAVEKGTSADGRIDWQTAAAHLWWVMKNNQKEIGR